MILWLKKARTLLTLEPSSLQQVSRIGPPMVCWALGTVLGVPPGPAEISQHLTLLSQDPATKKFCCKDAGEKARDEIESSEGLLT